MRGWRPVPGWPGFLVTRDGRLRGPAGRELRPVANATGHLYVRHRFGGRGNPNRALTVHRAVLLAFRGPCPEGQEARHLDGNPANNRLGNLRWGTRLEQRADDRRNGIRFGRPKKLTAAIVAEIRSLQGTASTREVGRRYGVHGTLVWKIWARQSWATA